MANLTETARWENGIYQLETSDPVMGGADGIDNLQAKQLGNRTLYLKQEVEKRSPIESPAFTGNPTAPTPAQTVNNTQIATTEFVKKAIAALVGSAPTTLDTLAEIATALGNDGNLKNVLLNEIGKKTNQTDFTTLKNLLIGIPFPYPLAAVPSGCLAFNGQAFNKTTYPILAQKYPSGVLPDLRGGFIRGWDNGRGVDAGRGLLSGQGDAIRDINGTFVGVTYASYKNIPNQPWYTGTGAFRRIADGDTGWDMNQVTTDRTNQVHKIMATSINFNASLAVPTANENRPRNIAFQYICLAA